MNKVDYTTLAAEIILSISCADDIRCSEYIMNETSVAIYQCSPSFLVTGPHKFEGQTYYAM